ncbi:MAG: universal stress protein [Flavobacteriales bacterium]|nr:universal stress protein [Flavobacteriales bacterium]MCL4283388.1 universal stress protein [Flavobacteriales bacterium]
MKNILVPLDLKAETERVLEEARLVAAARGAKLWLLHVAAPNPDFVGYEAGPQYIRDLRADTLKEEHAQLHAMAAELTGQGLETQVLLVMGSTSETILREADRIGADLIVMGTHGRRGLAKAFLGSTSDDVLRANRYPVLIIPTHLEP